VRKNGDKKELEKLTTERSNRSTRKLSESSIEKILKQLNREDMKVAGAVKSQIPQIAKAVYEVVSALGNGGRLFYVGAGTSGRLGVIDAAELYPTFGVGPEHVQAIIAGGPAAMFRSVEAAEDEGEMARKELRSKRLCSKDVVIGLSASGRTPFVIGALEYAAKKRAKRIGITVNPDSELSGKADILICPKTGPEALAGSTRMKAGTAEKMVLNMISTTAMVKMGKVLGNRMIGMKPLSEKLRQRAVRILADVAGLDRANAARRLEEAHMDLALATLMSLTGRDAESSVRLLSESGGSLAEAIKRDQMVTTRKQKG
jgi:N-acetylmuramic acid 6-phosphate etherase